VSLTLVSLAFVVATFLTTLRGCGFDPAFGVIFFSSNMANVSVVVWVR
jgi:hypothetical protein